MSEMKPCSECGTGYFEHLRWTKGGDGSHWEGCEEVHWDCRIAQLEAELKITDELLKEADAEIEELGAQEAEKRGEE